MCLYYLQVTVVKFQQNCLRKYAIDLKRSFNFISENPFLGSPEKSNTRSVGKRFCVELSNLLEWLQSV